MASRRKDNLSLADAVVHGDTAQIFMVNWNHSFSAHTRSNGTAPEAVLHDDLPPGSVSV